MMAEGQPGRGPRVVLGNDDPIQNEVGRIMLERLGCQVELASNGPSALERCKQRVFDLILMENNMAGMNAIEATSAIRGLPPPACHATIIGTGLTGTAYACQEAGMNDLLAKPLTVSGLRGLLMAWSSGKYNKDQSI